MNEKNFLNKNKRGDIPVTILVVGVFGVCALAIASFLVSTITFSNSFDGVSVMENANIAIEEAAFYNKPTDVYFYKNETYFSPEFGLNWVKQRTVFSVEYNSD